MTSAQAAAALNDSTFRQRVYFHFVKAAHSVLADANRASEHPYCKELLEGKIDKDALTMSLATQNITVDSVDSDLEWAVNSIFAHHAL